MQGIGDTLYARPFVKMLVEEGHDVFVETPLPFIFGDLPVKFLRTSTQYRTQAKALQLSTTQFYDAPSQVDRAIEFFYDDTALKRHNIVSYMETAFGYEAGSTRPVFDLPTNLAHHGLDLPLDRRIAVVRPVTHRSEWLCTSRSPKPNYVAWCSRMLVEQGFYVISVADTDGKREWIEADGDPVASLKLHHGELSIEQTLSLLRDTDVAIGGSGFIIPAAISAGTNLFVIFGGRGGYDNPRTVFDLRMPMYSVGWALPTEFCRCRNMTHDCNKEIKDLDSQFMRFMSNV